MTIAAFTALGLVIGLAHFAALRWTVGAYLHGKRNAVAWYVVRLVVSGALLFVLVRVGGPLVLAALVGFVIARSIAVRWAPKEAG